MAFVLEQVNLKTGTDTVRDT